MLKIHNLSKSYDGKKLSLDHISFAVEAGEVTSIIGPSGAGKTTLLRSINQLIRDDAGEIFFDGSQMRQLNKQQLRKKRRQIGMIFQNYNLIEPLSAVENVLHGRLGYKSTFAGMFSFYSRQEKQEALFLLKDVGLEEFAFTPCRNLSGGQKQRVGVARAVIQHPKLILCDEPIASLDPHSSKVIMDVLRSLAKERRISVVINLHQLEIAQKYSDHIIGINHGQIVFDGSPQELNEQERVQIYG
jgi:phosphonate transport system ATP-binding protein